MKRSLPIFAAGLALRLIAIVYLARVTPQMLTWGANEAGGIARWLVTNHTFSSPFHDAHGPTAWIAPIYPWIVACLFLLFGIQTHASAIAVMCFNALASAATGVVVYQIGNEIFSEEAGMFAGWLWALSPYVAILPYILWDTALSAFVFSVAILLTTRLSSSDSGKLTDWIAGGAVWGLAALVNPALLAPLPVLAMWLLERGKKWKQVFLVAAATAVIVAPWIVRNHIVFGKFVPVRSNGLTEIYFATFGFETHPLGSSMLYQTMGEAAFTAQAGAKAVAYIRSHPAKFLTDSARRAPWFWVNPLNFWTLSVVIDLGALAGLILVCRKSRNLAVLLVIVLVFYPLIYYASQVVSRYRHPIDPVLYALAGVALSCMISRSAARLFRRGI